MLFLHATATPTSTLQHSQLDSRLPTLSLLHLRQRIPAHRRTAHARPSASTMITTHTDSPIATARHKPLLRLPLQKATPQITQTLLSPRTPRAAERATVHHTRRQARQAPSRATASEVDGAAHPTDERRQWAGCAEGLVWVDGLVACAWTGEAGGFVLLIGPGQDCGDQVEDLEFLGVGAVEGEELEEGICY
jgi:hypothetical protein